MRKLTDKFWSYEMGAEMITTVKCWDHYIRENNREDALAMQYRWEAFQISFRYIFGFDVRFSRTEEYFGICDDNKNFFYKEEVKQEKEQPKTKSSDLFIGSMGHGVVISDKTKIEHGDYKKIAYIRVSGVIDWKVKPENLSPEAVATVQKFAESEKAEFMEEWNKLSNIEKYQKMFDLLLAADVRGLTIPEAIEKYFDEYLKKC